MDLDYLRGINYDSSRSVVTFSSEGCSNVPNINSVFDVFYRGLMDAHVPCVKPIGFYFMGTAGKASKSKLLVSEYCLESLPEIIEELSHLIFFVHGSSDGTAKFPFKRGNTITESDSVATSTCRGYGDNRIYNGATAYALTYTATNIETKASSKPELNYVNLADNASSVVRRSRESKELPIERRVSFDVVGNRKLVYTPKNKFSDDKSQVCMVVLLAEGTGNLSMKNISSMFVDQNDLLAGANRFVYLNTNFSYIDYLRILPRLGKCRDNNGNYEFRVAGAANVWEKFIQSWRDMLNSPEKRKWLGSNWVPSENKG